MAQSDSRKSKSIADGTIMGIKSRLPNPLRVQIVTASFVSASLVTLLALLSVTTVTHSQSGRQKQKAPNSNSNSNSGPRQKSKSTNSTASSSPGSTNSAQNHQRNDDESSDVVRVSSNLVPVPTTVLDSRGVAVTNLKLDDFELRDLTLCAVPAQMGLFNSPDDVLRDRLSRLDLSIMTPIEAMNVLHQLTEEAKK